MGINKNNSESLEKYHKIFIEQTPTAIAMLDKNMVYLAISQRWLKDYKLEEQEVIGRSHYDVFPEIGDDWKEHHKKCLQGAVDICDEAPFQRADGFIGMFARGLVLREISEVCLCIPATLLLERKKSWKVNELKKFWKKRMKLLV